MPVGCASIRLWSCHCSREYMHIKVAGSNWGWHNSWFYLCNTLATPMPSFTGRTFSEAPTHWWWGPDMKKERPKLKAHLEGNDYLKKCGLIGASVIVAYHNRRLVPMMARAFRCTRWCRWCLLPN